MGFKRLLSVFGVGGPSIDTVLANPYTYPGAALDGRIELTGGDVDAHIDGIAVALAASVEFDTEEDEETSTAEFARILLTGPFDLPAGERRSIPFRYPVPWQAPITDAGGGPLPDAGLGLRTEVVIDRAPDKGDLDPVHVCALPSQERILEAFSRLGFRLKHTDVEAGRLVGTRQEFPVFQEIEFGAAAPYEHEISEVEVSFVADTQGMDVIVEFDKRGGLFTEGGDLYGRFYVDHSDADRVDWTAQVEAWVEEALSRHRGLFGGFGTAHHDHGDHDEGGGMMSGAAGVALGVAGGLAAGYVAAEAVDEIGDFFGGEGEGEDESEQEEEDEGAEEEGEEEEEG
ncbi:sporulation protein [Streptomonospora salina]|uniref:Sporulation-control protein n=1 Tax=Streptomonospora salina TaxID=104205 RepID=A0A841E580_9ACTN|nr:sporulation protein [Streptomonospora salina]MBB5998166.1 sporulation-control protein [Streptomonospora salina]